MTPLYPAGDFSACTDEELAAHAAQLDGTISKLRKQMDELSAQLSDQVIVRKLLQEVLDKRALERSPSDWPLLLNHGENSSTALYEAAKARLEALAVDGHHRGIEAHGYFTETGQRALRISLRKGSPVLTERVHAALVQLLPHVRLVESQPRERGELGDSYKCISIFEYSLSEFGSYFLAIDEKRGLYTVCRARYSLRIEHQAKDLRSLLDYVEQHHYYSAVDESD